MSVKLKEAEKIFGPPGTGKTRRLITKVSWLINEKKIDPGDICYITFTNKGIDEVRERLKVTKQTDGYDSFATIHGLCNGFLKGKESRLVSEGDFEYWAKKEDGDLKKEFGGDLDNNFVIQVYNLYRVANISLREAFTKLNERNYKWNRLEGYVKSWEFYKQNNKLHDFTDQILNALDVDRFKEYKAVFLDEAQDSSWCQWQVIKKLMGMPNEQLNMMAVRKIKIPNIDGFKMDKEYDDVVFGYWGDTYISVNKEDYKRFIGEK